MLPRYWTIFFASGNADSIWLGCVNRLGPGIGDAMTGIASFLIVFASWRRGAKAVTLVRMIANVLLETAIGAIPVAGDVFHVIWKANRRNYRLLIREKEQPGAGVGRDWIFLAVLCGGGYGGRDSDSHFNLAATLPSHDPPPPLTNETATDGRNFFVQRTSHVC